MNRLPPRPLASLLLAGALIVPPVLRTARNGLANDALAGLPEAHGGAAVPDAQDTDEGGLRLDATTRRVS